jgi:hypothetical protein
MLSISRFICAKSTEFARLHNPHRDRTVPFSQRKYCNRKMSLKQKASADFLRPPISPLYSPLKKKRVLHRRIRSLDFSIMMNKPVEHAVGIDD